MDGLLPGSFVLRTSGVDACEVRFTVSVEGDAVHDLGVLDCERR